MTRVSELGLMARGADHRRRAGDGAVGALTLTSDLRVRSVDPAFAALLGRKPEEIAGAPLRDITHPDDVAVGEDLLRRAFSGELASFQLEQRYLAVDGSAPVVEITVTTVPIAGLGRVAVGRLHLRPDQVPPLPGATEAVLLKLSAEHQARHLLHEAWSAVLGATAEDEAVERVLRVLCVELGWSIAIAHLVDDDGTLTPAAVVQLEQARCLRSLRPRTTSGPHAARVRRVIEARRLLYESPDDAHLVPPCRLSWLGIPIVAGDAVTGVIELATTKTSGLADETTDALADIGALLGRALQRIRLEASATDAEAATAVFAARAVHDMRSPIAAGGLALDTLARHADDLDRDQRQRLLATADRSMAQLRGLVGRLLELAHVDHDVGMELTDVELAPLVRGVAADLALAFGHPVHVDVHDGLMVTGEEVALNQLVGNLVTNALQHAGETATVTVTASVTDHGAVSLVVADDGPGVPPALAASLFEPFTRGAGSEGTGLGLTISKRLAHSLGGDLTHRPNEPHGSTFTLTLRGPR